MKKILIFILLGISSCEKEDSAPLIFPSIPEQPSNGYNMIIFLDDNNLF